MTDTNIVDPHVREWLQVPVKHDERPPIRYTSKGRGMISLENLTERELQAMEQFLSGTSWVRCVNGRLAAASAFNPLPEPEDDPILAEHWNRTSGELKVDGLFPPNRCSASIVIESLGAGCNTQQELRSNIKLAKSMGFICLRSRRDDNGKYWETWHLFGEWQARGILRTHCDELSKGMPFKQRVDSMTDFIARRAGLRFGTLDVTVQRWALTYGGD